MTLGSGTLTFGGDNTSTKSRAVISGRGGLIKQGTGLFQLLGGPNTYSGGTTIIGGTVGFLDDAAFGAATGVITLDGGTLEGFDVGPPAFLRAPHVVTLNSGGGTFTGDLFVAGTVGGVGGLTVTGGVGLGGTNTHGGATTIDAGALGAVGGSAIPNGSAVRVNGGAFFGIVNSETIGSLSNGSGGGGEVFEVLGGAATLTTGGDNTNASFSGAIFNGFNSGVLALTKIGTGTQALSGVSTYTAATVNGGTFIDGTILRDHGELRRHARRQRHGPELIVNSGGTLSPGASAGILTTSGVSFASGAFFRVELGGTTPGTGHDQVVANGNVNLGGATLTASILRVQPHDRHKRHGFADCRRHDIRPVPGPAGRRGGDGHARQYLQHRLQRSHQGGPHRAQRYCARQQRRLRHRREQRHQPALATSSPTTARAPIIDPDGDALRPSPP